METKNLEIFKPTTFGTDVLSINADLDDYFFMKQLQNRMIYLCGEIDSGTVNATVQSIMLINIEDRGIPKEERIPIKLLLSSDGGDVLEGFSIVDAIENSLTPVITINMSHWYSMATIIGMVGHLRYASKNASFLIHDGTTVIGDSSSKVHDFLRFDAQIQDKMKQVVLEHSEIPARTYNKKSREEWYFFAEEAKKLGVIDGIIGKDISLEEII